MGKKNHFFLILFLTILFASCQLYMNLYDKLPFQRFTWQTWQWFNLLLLALATFFTYEYHARYPADVRLYTALSLLVINTIVLLLVIIQHSLF